MTDDIVKRLRDCAVLIGKDYAPGMYAAAMEAAELLEREYVPESASDATADFIATLRKLAQDWPVICEEAADVLAKHGISGQSK